MRFRSGIGVGIFLLLAGAAILVDRSLHEPAPAPLPSPAGPQAPPDTAPREPAGDPSLVPLLVERVLDGDTLVLAGGKRVRLLGIDAPEIDAPFHDEALKALRDLAEGREIRLEGGRGPSTDSYGRLLALVRAGDVLLNEILVERGLALVYLKEEGEIPDGVRKALVESQNRAIDARRGIWSRPESLATPPGGLRGSRNRFHRPDCPEIEGMKLRSVTREAAVRSGKSPCRSCLGKH
jgi:micrococcal nuclease